MAGVVPIGGVAPAGGAGSDGVALVGGLTAPLEAGGVMPFSGGAAAGEGSVIGAAPCEVSLVLAEVSAAPPVLAEAISMDFRSAREACR